MRSPGGCGTDGCGRTSAKSRPSTMPSPPSTRPSGSRGRRSSAFVRKDSGRRAVLPSSWIASRRTSRAVPRSAGTSRPSATPAPNPRPRGRRAEAFGASAERELLATGESVCRRVVETREVLTAQEAQIARLGWGGALELRDRLATIHQPAHGRVPPPQGVHQAPASARATNSTVPFRRTERSLSS